MKKLFKTFVLAGVLAAATTSGAFAGGNHQAMAQRNWEYFNQKKESSKASGVQQVSDTVAAPKASQYPCANCVYDQQQGGYVQKNYGKR